jgi:mRNA (2'-O-methyladenosine-N6-)-methyltransferase
MTDSDLKAMRIPDLQKSGFIFLWVTMRAIELGRECLLEWGYVQFELFFFDLFSHRNY